MGKAASKPKHREAAPSPGSQKRKEELNSRSMDEALSKITSDGKKNLKATSKTLHSSFMSSDKKSNHQVQSLNRSIQWAEELAVDMEENNPSVRAMEKTFPTTVGKPITVRTTLSDDDATSETLSRDSSGVFTRGTHEELEVTELEGRLVSALKKRLSDQNSQKGPKPIKNLNSILLKFPHVKDGFEKMRAVFKSVDTDRSGSIDFKEWSSAISVGMSMNVPEDLKLKLWKEADVDGNNMIDFREFILVITFLYMMGYINVQNANVKLDPPSPVHLQGKPITIMGDVGASIDLVVDAFLFFDKDGNGRIMKNEVMEALVTMGGVSGGKYAEANVASGIWRRRFEEMDCDNSGCISFKEFILGFENWVGFDEEDEEEE